MTFRQPLDTGSDQYLPEQEPWEYEPPEGFSYDPSGAFVEMPGVWDAGDAEVVYKLSLPVAWVLGKEEFKTLREDRDHKWLASGLNGTRTQYWTQVSANVGVTSLYLAGSLAAAEAACTMAQSNSAVVQTIGQTMRHVKIAGHGYGAGKSIYDIYENGANEQNLTALAMHVISIVEGLDSCFTAGTQIVVGIGLADDGTILYDTKNIEDIQVGDLVYSYNTMTGETELCEVTDTLAKTSNHINYLTIVDEDGNEQVIETTDVHPFWVVTDEPDLERAARSYADGMYHENLGCNDNGFWVEAKDLRVGDVFLGANGELSTLTNIVRVEQEGGIAVFNFEVGGNHNYFYCII